MDQYDFVGVDIAKDKFDVVILGDKKQHKIFANSITGFKSFVIWLKKQTALPWVCMEATGHYSEPLAEYLHQEMIRISMVNPLQIKHYSKALLTRNKNDKLDATIIAQYAQQMKPRAFVPRKEEQKSIREITQLLETLKKQLQALKNQEESTRTAAAQKALKKAILSLEKQIKALEEDLRKMINEDKNLSEAAKLLKSIKGIGEKSAYSILAYLPDLDYFDHAKQLAAYIGLSPRQYESGKMKGKTSLTCFGHARLRKILYMPALSAKRHNKALRPFVLRLEKNGLKPKAIVGAIMRKLAHLIFGILKHRKPFEAALACAS